MRIGDDDTIITCTKELLGTMWCIGRTSGKFSKTIMYLFSLRGRPSKKLEKLDFNRSGRPF
jgi:hypothetical protein